MFLCMGMLLLCLCQTEWGRVGALQQTADEEATGLVHNIRGDQYSAARQHFEGPLAAGGLLRHGRRSREILGGGLSIDTLPDNVTHRVEDSGRYYTWQSLGPEDQRTRELWVDMNDLQHGQVRMHGLLSNAHRQAASVAMSFDFPFYGHYLRQVTIATGGFIFMGDVTHRMLTATQYVAPLMANFDPSYSRESTVQYLDNASTLTGGTDLVTSAPLTWLPNAVLSSGQVFVVQWEKVRLLGRETEGAFTFQAALYRTGDIAFSYRDIPFPVDMIGSGQHLKAGLSDAFMVTLPSPRSPGGPKRTLYEYHRAEINTAKIVNHSAFQFTALPTCLQHASCDICLSSNQTSGCSWCNILQRCSDGMDRHRQEWLDYACSEESPDTTCEDYAGPEPDNNSTGPSASAAVTSTTPFTARGCRVEDEKTVSPKQRDGMVNIGVVAGVVAVLLLLLALVMLALYITCHPSLSSSFYFAQRREQPWQSLKFRRQGFQRSYTEMEGQSCEKNSIVEAGLF